MRKNRLFAFVLKTLLLGFFLFAKTLLNAQTINLAGNNWNLTIPSITQAGMDYSGTYESSNNLVTISGFLPGSFLSLLGSSTAKVSVHYVPNLWNNGLHLYAKRTGGNASVGGLCIACSATINDGLNYIEIPQGIDNTLFTIKFNGLLGLGNSVSYSNVNVQLKLSGVSVALPVDSYSATIVFTVGAL